jgi:cold shock protein
MSGFATDRVYVALLALAVGLSVAAAILANEIAVGLLAGAVGASALALLWHASRIRRLIQGPMIGNGGEFQEITEDLSSSGGIEVSEDAKSIARGRVESWDEEAGWGVLSAPELPSGVFAHFSAVEGEGYRTLKVGGPVSFDYVDAAGGAGSQDGCSFVAERVVQLDD